MVDEVMILRKLSELDGYHQQIIVGYLKKQ